MKFIRIYKFTIKYDKNFSYKIRKNLVEHIYINLKIHNKYKTDSIYYFRKLKVRFK